MKVVNGIKVMANRSCRNTSFPTFQKGPSELSGEYEAKTTLALPL